MQAHASQRTDTLHVAIPVLVCLLENIYCYCECDVRQVLSFYHIVLFCIIVYHAYVHCTDFTGTKWLLPFAADV